MKVVSQATGSLHKPCAFNPNGASEEYCKSLSCISARQAQGCNACSSRWKHKVGEKVDARRPSLAPVGTSELSRPAVVPRPPVRPVTAAEVPRMRPVVVPLVTANAATRKATVPDVVPPKDDEPWRGVLQRIQKAMANGVLVKLPPSRLRPMPGQPREYFDEGDLGRLEMSIREVGQIQLGLCRGVPRDDRDSDHELLDGERRWRVVSRLELPEYRALKVDIDDEAAPYIVAAISNFNRADHTAMEIANAVNKLHHGLGMPMKAVADMMGFKSQWAYMMAGLKNLHQEVRDMLDPVLMGKSECLPTMAAIHISKLDASLQTPLAVKFMEGGISLPKLRAEVIRMGESHGKPVRTWRDEPARQFTGMARKARNLTTLVGDLQTECDKTHFGYILSEVPKNRVSQLVQDLTSAQSALAHCLERIKTARNTK